MCFCQIAEMTTTVTVCAFRNFDNYRIRTLLYAAKPNWPLLHTASFSGGCKLGGLCRMVPGGWVGVWGVCRRVLVVCGCGW